jgi:hypothetical protein
MARLDDISVAIKSANAGASWITFDIVFEDVVAYRHAQGSGVLNADLFARTYRVNPAQVRIHYCEPVLTIKATIPRSTSSGGADETDFDGVQQFIPLLSVQIPE